MKSAITTAQRISQKGSRTYYTASLFFSPGTRKKVTILYAFVRLADNFVDQIPPQTVQFASFVQTYRQVVAGKEKSTQVVITDFVALSHEVGIEQSWVEAFIASMQQDLTKKTYNNLSEVEAYMYGSANVIGLMMAKILQLPKESYPTAELLGKAMQYCNMLRDIDEDLDLGRVYLPVSQLRKFNLYPFSKELAYKRPKQFRLLFKCEAERCEAWFKQATKGLQFIPRKERVAVATALNMYLWTLSEIKKNPHLVFSKKLKPSKYRIITSAIKSFLKPN